MLARRSHAPISSRGPASRSLRGRRCAISDHRLLTLAQLAVPRRNAATVAERRAALPNSAADWSSFVSKRLGEIPDSAETASKRKGLQELKAFIEANPAFILERSEELKSIVVPSWEDSMVGSAYQPLTPFAAPVTAEVLQKRIHATAAKLAAASPLSQVLKTQDEIGLLQTLNFSTNSATTNANIKELEGKRDALVASLLKDPKLAADTRADLEKFSTRVAQAGVARELKMTTADREEHVKRMQDAKDAEDALLKKILKTDDEKATYLSQVEAKQKEYKRFDQNTVLGRLLYGNK